MAVLHQKIDAVLFGRDGIRIVGIHALHHLRVGDVEFVAAGSALVGAYLAGDDHARLLRQPLDRLEQFGRNCVLGHHALDDAATVAELREQQLAALAQVVQPSADGDALAFVLADFPNRRQGCRRCFHVSCLSAMSYCETIPAGAKYLSPGLQSWVK